MSSSDEITSEYKDVIGWLRKNMASNPAGTAKIINSYINVITYAFDKPYEVIEDLVHLTEFDALNEEELKILELYYSLLQKRLKR